MPVTVSKMAANEASVKLEGGTLGNDTATVIYYPGHVTEEAITVFASLENATTSVAAAAAFQEFNEMLAGKPKTDTESEKLGLIKSWDVLEDDGTMFPIDARRFSSLPLAFRMQVFTAIMQDIRPEAVAPQTSQMSNSSH